MEIQCELNKFFGWEKKILQIKNFEFLMFKINPKSNNSTEEFRIHIKFINIISTSPPKFDFKRSDTNEKFSIKCLTEEDCNNFVSNLKFEQKNYEQFLKEYYNENNSYNLIDNDSFYDYFKNIYNFLNEMENNVKNIKMDENLEKILNIQKQFLIKINFYIEIINRNKIKLNEKIKEENNLIQQSNDILNLLNEIKNIITNCTFGLDINEIKNYISNFVLILNQKNSEIRMLIEEIKYNLDNYLTLKNNGNNNENVLGENLGTEEEEIAKLLLENENLKIQIENFETENEIIEEYLKENGEKIN
jgi:hypothetical protein